jgi:hypothetical protein
MHNIIHGITLEGGLQNHKQVNQNTARVLLVKERDEYDLEVGIDQLYASLSKQTC